MLHQSLHQQPQHCRCHDNHASQQAHVAHHKRQQWRPQALHLQAQFHVQSVKLCALPSVSWNYGDAESPAWYHEQNAATLSPFPVESISSYDFPKECGIQQRILTQNTFDTDKSTTEAFLFASNHWNLKCGNKQFSTWMLNFHSN